MASVPVVVKIESTAELKAIVERLERVVELLDEINTASNTKPVYGDVSFAKGGYVAGPEVDPR